MSLVLTFFVVLYSVFMLFMLAAWLALPQIVIPENYRPNTFLSVLIPVRNEADNILNLLQDLEKQEFPKELFEVLILNDASEDNTITLVKDFRERSDLNLKLISAEKGRAAGKKSMLALGQQFAKGVLIVQTDGDCRVEPKWLVLLEYIFISRKVKFISGPVKLIAGNSLFGKMQLTEFASLIGTGAAAIGLGIPNMCNGANLAFAKEAFDAVNGYAGNQKIASGDDEFLMHKIRKQFPGSLFFLKDRQATVSTKVQPNLKTFLAQRVRWASKWKFYKNNSAQLVGLLVFGTNFSLLIGLALWLGGFLNFNDFWLWYIAKCVADFVFLGAVLRFLNQGRFLIYFLPWQLVYFPYVVYCALAGLRGKYTWKGRTLTNP